MKIEQFIASFPQPLVAVFRTLLHTGWVPQNSAMGADSASPPVYRTFGHFVSSHASLAAGWEQVSVRDFLAQPSPQGTVRDTLRWWLQRMQPWLLDMALEQVELEAVGEHETLIALARTRLVESGMDQFVSVLLSTFEQEMSDLTLKDAFLRRRHEIGFASWSPENADRLREEETESPAGRRNAGPNLLYLDVYSNSDEDDDCAAVEWVGGIKDPDRKEWGAVAAGMLYHFNPRVRGNRALMLVRAADEVSAGDLARADAFLSAHRNSEQILKKGDIAFVWQWERRHGTQPGTGVECLMAICNELRSRYRKLKSIVFALSPERFAPRAPGEPALIAEARLSDLDKLQAYVSALGPHFGLDVYMTASDRSDVSPP